MWTASQRRALIGVVVVLSIGLGARYGFNRRFVSDPQPARPARVDELADRIDPNVATVEELVVLPQLGEKRAAEIVAYREKFRKENGGKVAFAQVEDLLPIKGIGAAMIQALGPHLKFPTTRETNAE
jgi:DNA uptake protein ComE-like DNA-binding protein